jgi:hypothetical protein
MRRFALLLTGLALTGCASKTVYLLADGRLPSADPALNQQFLKDQAACNDAMVEANQMGDHRDGAMTRGVDVEETRQNCMSESGYVLVPQDQVAAKQQELAATAAENARRDAAAATPPPSPPTPSRHTAAIKPKPPQPAPTVQ